MPSPTLKKLQKKAYRLLGRSIYTFTYSKHKIKALIKKINSPNPSFKRPNFVWLITNFWRSTIMLLLLIIALYYGIGAAISNKINNRLDEPYKSALAPNDYTLQALAQVLKIQINQEPWTPALPLIFPASLLDNLKNFQLGAKESTHYYIKRLSAKLSIANLKDADKLLNYPPDIWLFAKTKENSFAPGSAKQYRKAIALIEETVATNSSLNTNDISNFRYLLKLSENLLAKDLNRLNKHMLEHSSELTDLRADDIYYKAMGTAYTMHYVLLGLSKDYQSVILELDLYQDLTTALKYLSDATALKPLIIKNGAPHDIFAANHLLYMAYCLTNTLNHVQKIDHALQLKLEKTTDAN